METCVAHALGVVSFDVRNTSRHPISAAVVGLCDAKVLGSRQVVEFEENVVVDLRC